MISYVLLVVSSAQATPPVDGFIREISGRSKVEAALVKSENPHIKPFASVVSAAIWPSTSIFVCWINPNEENSQGRAWVQEAVEKTWQKESALKFLGWERCAPTNSGIRILVEDSGPHVTTLGRFLDEYPNKMVLNFTFNAWSQDCKKSLEKCIKSIAVHEFGHGIGFVHEQNRPPTRL